MRIPLRSLIPPRFREIDPIDPAEVAVWARDYAFAARMHLRSTLDPTAPKALGIPGSRVHVVCIPGVIEGWHFMEPLAKRLVRAGFAAHFVPELGRNVAPVLDSAPVVGAVVDRVAAAHPHASIVLVGHSKGGLIGKRLLVDRALEPSKPQPAGLVTLATPFAGSSRAALLPGGYIREFDPANAMLTALAAERSADARIRVVLPQIDPHVPKNRVPDGMRGVRLRESGHFRPLATAEAARAIVAAIDELTGAPASRAGLEGAEAQGAEAQGAGPSD